MKKLRFALSIVLLVVVTSCTKEKKPAETASVTTTDTYKYSRSGNVSAISLFTTTAPYTDPADPNNNCWVFEEMPNFLAQDSADAVDESIQISSDNKLTFMYDGIPFVTIQATRSSDGGYVVTSALTTTKFKVIGNQLFESNAYAAIESGDPETPDYSQYVAPVGVQTPVEAIREQIEGGYRKIGIKTFDRIYTKQ